MNAYGSHVTTIDELETLDTDEVIEGYRDGRGNEPEPQGNRSKSYWHGWRNGMIDGGHMKSDAASKALAAAYLAHQRASRP